MTWPSGAVDTADTDAGTDNPQNARADILDAMQKLNQIIAHVSAYIQGLLDDADAAAARATLGLGAMATKATVATADIDADAVTYAKIQNISATDKLLGRSTAGAGDAEEIACTAAGRAILDDADAAAQRVTLKVPTDQMGTGSGVATLVGKANVNTSVVGNVGTGVDDLLSYALPANTLSANGKGIRITAQGATANNANAKTLRFVFGVTNVMNWSLTPSISGAWRVVIEIFRTSTGNQVIFYSLEEVVTGVTLVTPKKAVERIPSAQDETTALDVRFTGEATANNDIQQQEMLVEYLG